MLGWKVVRRVAIPVAAIASLCVGAAMAFGSIPDASDGVIHACYASNGAVRVIDVETKPPQTCGKGQTPLSWNQKGVKGNVGPVGPVGPQGPAGESGMQQVYFAQGQGTSSPVTANGQGGDFELATGPVPAGSYTAEAQISAYDAESHLRCILQDTTFRQLEPADDNPTAPAGQHFTIFGTLEMTAAFTKTDDLPVHLDCLTEDTTPGLTTKLDANLLVTKVASVN